MNELTHAIYDTLNGGDQVGDGYPNVALALEEAAKLGGSTKGFVVDRIRWKPPGISKTASPEPSDETSISDMPEASPPKPEASRAAVAQGPEGPGLFD